MSTHSARYFMESVYSFSNIIVRSFGMYMVWIMVHHTASQLYAKSCASTTCFGFLLSLFIIPSPYCQALRWAIYNGGNSIGVMWVIGGWYIMRYLVPINNDRNQ
jgi:hypothetical protein